MAKKKPVDIDKAKQARQIARSDLTLAKKLNKEKDYYDWVVVVLFYSACALMTAICNIEGVTVPEQHKGRWNEKINKWEDGMLDRAKKYLSQRPYDSYSLLLIWSQTLRYDPEDILNFRKRDDTPETIKKCFKTFQLIVNNFNNKYERYF